MKWDAPNRSCTRHVPGLPCSAPERYDSLFPSGLVSGNVKAILKHDVVNGLGKSLAGVMILYHHRANRLFPALQSTHFRFFLNAQVWSFDISNLFAQKT